MPVSPRLSFFMIPALLLALGGTARAETATAPTLTPQAALAMHGAPKYAAGFDHFDYTNPDAPKGGILKLGIVGTFDSLNPFIIRGNPALGLATGYMSLTYESLLTRGWDEPFTLYGLIAESVEVPDDRSAITFNLRQQAHWSDGQPITADDVLFSFNTLREQGRPNHRMYYKKVASVEKLGERRIRFTFKKNERGESDREMPLIMGLMPILPAHDWEGRNFNQTTLRPPIGSGPYKISKLDVGRSITYTRDANYWGRDLNVTRGLYNFNEIRMDYYRDDAIALQAFKAGQYDLRKEPDPNKWATAYDFAAAKDGRAQLETFPHHRTEPINGFIFNTRRALFADEKLREALSLAFDFGWINRNLFHGLYKRSTSFFPNSELASNNTDIPTTDGSEESLRQNLVRAAQMLKAADYVMRDEKLFDKNNAPVKFEILLSDPAEEKIALQWARALQRLGITATTRTVDSAQYQARIASFDFDVTINKWFNSLSPGNEQMLFWSSAAASQQGSRNYPGIRDANIDALAASIPSATSREDLIEKTRALDRALLSGHYIVPFFHLGADLIAYWNKINHPEKTPLYGPVLESWWFR